MKRCTLCGETLELALFNKKASSSDGHQNVCRECNRAQARRYYANNRAKHLSIIMERTKRTRAAAQDYIGEYLATHPCADCGEADVRVLDFDHRPGSDKAAEVMRLVRAGHGLRQIVAEIAKCDVRCRNCHARVTYERAGDSWRHRWALRHADDGGG